MTELLHGYKSQRTATQLKCSPHVHDFITNRTLGFYKRQIGYTDNFECKFYNSFQTQEDEFTCERNFTCFGGIFNLEFSHDGRLLVAACENKQILLFDAATQKQFKTLDNAHLNCVNCIRFLDDRTFVSGSDDSLIKLWDLRNLKAPTKTLHGHSNWIKNIEWSEPEQLMVTSAFDGTIFTWDLKEKSENNSQFEKVFLMSGLMRMKLSPDGTKMVISTTNGFMIIIHNLNLSTLANDLKSFRPNLYRLMQTSDQSFPIATTYNYLFHPSRKRNRLEFIEDFPIEAEAISSLQIHPYGWCAVSRSLNGEEVEEWTAIHDIQDRDPKDYENAYTYIEDFVDNDSSGDEPSNHRPTDLWMGYISLEDRSNNTNGQARLEMGIINSGLIGHNSSYNAYFQQHPEEKNKIVRNLPRMTHFIKEKNVGKGYIKGLSFSRDGRIICSPYNKGIRLLAFSDKCQELSDCVPETPEPLKTVVEMSDCHRDIVVSCRFNPQHYQLVSGCLGSQIRWHQPVF